MQQSVTIQLVQHLTPGGIESLALDLCESLSNSQSTYLVSLEGTKEDALIAWPRLQTFEKQLIFLDKPEGWSFKILLKLIYLFRKLAVDSLHTHHIGPMIYGGLASKLTGIKNWVHTEHDAWHLQNKKHCAFAKFYWNHFKPKLVADASLVAEHIKSSVLGSHPSIIYNGVNTKRFTPGCKEQARRQLGLSDQWQIIGCAARLHQVKGQHRLIKLLKYFPYRVHLVLAGTGQTQQDLLDLSIKLDVADRVHFLGSIDDMPTFYRALDIFCLTSDYEGLPLAPLEAQACNIPSLVTDVGASKETICPDTGAVVSLDDQVNLILSVAKLLAITNQKQSRDFVIKHYDIDIMVNKYKRLLNGESFA